MARSRSSGGSTIAELGGTPDERAPSGPEAVPHRPLHATPQRRKTGTSPRGSEPMRRYVIGVAIIGAIAAMFYSQYSNDPEPIAPPPPLPAPADPAAPLPAPPELAGASLLEGLGNYQFAVTSKHPDAQRWFNQGVMLTYGFNHDAAERSFLKATQLDPECAMCWWGAALVLRS